MKFYTAQVLCSDGFVAQETGFEDEREALDWLRDQRDLEADWGRVTTLYGDLVWEGRLDLLRTWNNSRNRKGK